MKFPVVWSFPNVPEQASDQSDTAWIGQCISFLKQLLVVIQLVISAVAQKVNNELVQLAGINAMTGSIDLSSGTQFIPPYISGDFASPTHGELWYNSALHHYRLATDNEGVQSLAMIRPLAQNQAVAGSVSSVAVTLNPVEADTNYQVVVEASWGTTLYITSKAAGGFTINFGTATPGSETITYCLLR